MIMTLRDSEAEDKEYKHSKKKTEKSTWYTVLRDWDVICNSLEEEEGNTELTEKKMCIMYLTDVFTAF